MIKSPPDHVVGMVREMNIALPAITDYSNAYRIGLHLWYYMAVEQMEITDPPNVAGWPGGKSWIDSSSLMLRLRMPQIFTANDVMDIKPKTDDDVQGGMMEAGAKKMKDAVKGSTAKTDWVLVAKIFEAVPREKLLQKITDTVLQTKAHVSDAVLEKYLNNENRENFTKSVIVNLMSTPEYQLC